jgi:hypothetical protein
MDIRNLIKDYSNYSVIIELVHRYFILPVCAALMDLIPKT